MSAYTLSYPVYTLDRRLLLSEGTELTEDTLRSVVDKNDLEDCQILPFLSYNSVKKDILSFIDIPPYNVIFREPDDIAELLRYLEGVKVVLPILRSLDYFKEHDFHTYRHILMVLALSTRLAKDILPDYEEQIRLASRGPVHDFGKICVPLNILKKTTPLTRREQSMIEHHALAGYVLLIYYLKDTKAIAPIVARDHHERKDGSGYPKGIKLNDRMVEIIAVADVYDALIEPRPYRPASYDNRTALEEITLMAERGMINWDVVGSLIAYNRKERQIVGKDRISVEKRGKPPENNLHGVVVD